MKFINPYDFEKHIKLVLEYRFKKSISKIELAKPNQKGFDISLELKNGKKYAVQVKNWKIPINQGAIKRFLDFLNSDEFKIDGFDGGIFISSSRYSKTVPVLLETSNITNIELYQYKDDSLIDIHLQKESFLSENLNKNINKNLDQKQEIKIEKSPTYIGVFTAKGGVGKTTISAHLAGAFALHHKNIILLDLDTQSNLKKLLGEEVIVEKDKSSIKVLNYNEWDEKKYKDIDFVICDCSPNFKENNPKLIEKFDYCITPTTLNPLGISKHSDVIERTFRDLREINKKAKFFILINNFRHTSIKRQEQLSNLLRLSLNKLKREDSNFEYINPIGEDGIKIRYSDSLYFWGFHIITNELPKLGFDFYGGRSHPREDFLEVTEFLLNKMDK